MIFLKNITKYHTLFETALLSFFTTIIAFIINYTMISLGLNLNNLKINITISYCSSLLINYILISSGIVDFIYS